MIKNKKSLFVLIFVFVVLGFSMLASFSISKVFAGDECDGSKDAPYQISTPDELSSIANSDGVYYKQTADIEIDDLSNGYLIGEFRGVYDGDGHKITINLYDKTCTDAIGFIGLLIGEIKNLNIEYKVSDTDIIFSESEDALTFVVGGVACCIGECDNPAIINNVHVYGNMNVEVVQSQSNQSGIIGGIAGIVYNCEIKNCSNEMDMNISLNTIDDFDVCYGGIVGEADSLKCSIEACYNWGNLTLNCSNQEKYTCANIGGIIGGIGVFKETENDKIDMSIEYSYNTGKFSVKDISDSFIGGLVGFIGNYTNNLLITQSYNIGDYVCQNSEIAYCGGVIGCAEDVSVTTNLVYDASNSDKIIGSYKKSQDYGSKINSDKIYKSDSYVGWLYELTPWIWKNATCLIKINGEWDAVKLPRLNFERNALLEDTAYIVTFDKNNSKATGEMTSQKVFKVKETQLKMNTFSYTGYKFAGWKNSDETLICDDCAIITTDNDITLYAKWTAEQYNVTLDYKGHGEQEPSNINVTYDSTYGSNLPASPSATGYTFGGWFLNDSFTGEAVTCDTKVTMVEDHTLYAKWTAITYTVTLNKNGGDGGTNSVTATYDSAMPTGEEIIAPTRTGYTFVGYYFEINGGGKQYYTDSMGSANNWDVASDTTLYAKWTANQYNVTLDYKGHGEQEPSNINVTYDSTYGSNLPASPSATGYTFGGWFLNDSFTGEAVTCDTKVTVAEKYTLYAKWTAIIYTVTFNKQDGSGGTSSVTATYGSAMPTGEEIIAPTRTGYTFGGYYTETGGGGTQYYTSGMGSANNWDVASDTTLYAKWTANTYTVTLNRQDGSGRTSSVTATYGLAMPSATAPTRSGYTFGGYYTSTNGGGTQYYTSWMTSARNWDCTSAKTLYAKWTAKKYTVTLDMQDGDGGTSSVKVTYGSAMPTGEEIIAPTRTGYTFGGYYTETGGGGTQYYTDSMGSANNWDVASGTTLYAKWTANTYTVTFNKQDGTGGSDSVTATFGLAMPTGEEIIAPTRTGYTFGGYYTETGGGGTQYYTSGMGSANNWDVASDTTLYAKWTANTYTVTLNMQDGDGGTSSVKVTYGSAMPSATAPTRTGYTFGGYYTSTNGGGTQYYTNRMKSARNWNYTSSKTLYAYWKEDSTGSGTTGGGTTGGGDDYPTKTLTFSASYSYTGSKGVTFVGSASVSISSYTLQHATGYNTVTVTLTRPTVQYDAVKFVKWVCNGTMEVSGSSMTFTYDTATAGSYTFVALFEDT